MELLSLHMFIMCLRLINFITSRGSAVGIATGHGLYDLGVGVQDPVGSKIVSLHVVQTGSGANPIP
jgi:hypothetical protein